MALFAHPYLGFAKRS